MVNSANVRVTTGNPTADTILKWGFWIGIGLATYRLYRVVRYDDPFIQPSYRLPPAWEANPRKIDEEKRARALELYEPGEPVGPVAKAVGVSINTIIRWMKEAGIYEAAPMRPSLGPRDTAAFKRALELYKPGEPVGPVAEAVGVSPMTIINWMKKAGIYEAAPMRPSLGSRDTAAFKRALELYEPGEPVGPVAKAVGVDPTTIINWMKKAGIYETAKEGPRDEAAFKRALELYEPGEPVGPVAKAVGVDPTTIIDWMKKAGRYKAAPVGPSLGPRDTAAFKRALELYEPGEPVGPVAKAVGVSINTIIRWMKEAGRYEPAPTGRFEQKDLDEKRALAFALYEPGEPVGPVAKAVGVSINTIIRWMKEAGIYEAAREGPRDTASYERALELYEPGRPVEPVAKAVGVSSATIINWMKKAGRYEAAPVGGRGSRKKPSKNPWFMNGLRFF